jgi:predicted ATPase
LRYPAVTLFVERARSSNAGFTIDDAIAPAIAEIVRQLDGLPLGIELAAARAGEMSPSDLLAYLQTRLTNLGSERHDPDSRHHSMRALMDWSFERLTELERMVYCRASIFSGSFDATALSAVCSDFLSLEDATDIVLHLARKSLLEIDLHATPTQFAMLKTVREYGREQLQKTLDFNFGRWLHACFYLELTVNMMRVFRAEDQGEAFQSMKRAFPNVREALDWCFATHNEHVGAVIVSELAEYWDARGEYREGEEWIRRALDVDDALKTRPTQAVL